MKKVLLSIAFVVMMVSNVFAYTWVQAEGSWYVYNDESGEKLKNILLDTGDNVYYLNEDGKLITGWWKNKQTDKIYFFDNNEDRNFGGMVFGLKMVDGYYRYFGDDGSLQRADSEDSYKKVYLEYWADFKGNLYLNNELMRDTTINKSEFYSNPAYYYDVNLNNFYLASYDTAVDPVVDLDRNGPAVTDLERDRQSTGSKKSSASRTSGGADYYVDENGHVVVPDKTGTISADEKYGPRRDRG